MVLPTPKSTLPEVKHLSISPQGKFLAVSRGHKIELWDFPRRKMLRFIPSTGGGAVAFSPDEKWLAVAGYHNRLKIHDVESGSQLGEIHAQIGILVAADFSSDGRTLVACSEGVTKVFSVEKNGDEVILSELAAIRSGLGADISANGKWLASGGYSGKVWINRIPSGRPMSSFPVADGNDSVYETKFSSDNTQLVVGGMLGKGPTRRGAVQIWNVKDVLDPTGFGLQK
jgi:WD40 repeat protein